MNTTQPWQLAPQQEQFQVLTSQLIPHLNLLEVILRLIVGLMVMALLNSLASCIKKLLSIQETLVLAIGRSRMAHSLVTALSGLIPILMAERNYGRNRNRSKRSEDNSIESDSIEPITPPTRDSNTGRLFDGIDK